MAHIRHSHSRKRPRPRAKVAISPRKSPSQARAKETVDAILAATAHILSNGGFAALNTNKVAERAGVSIGSLYQYFPGKDALITALVEAEAQNIADILATHATDAAAPFPSRVRGLIRGLIATHRGDTQLHTALVQYGKRLGPASPMVTLDHSSIALVAEQFRTEPTVRVRDAELAAFLLYYAVEGALQAVTADRPSLLAEGSPLEDELCRLILRYLEVKSPGGAAR